MRCRWLIGLFACHANVSLPPLPDVSGAASSIVILEYEGELDVVARDHVGPVVVTAPFGSTVTLMVLDRPLDTLLIPTGTLVAETSPPVRSLPAADSIHQITLTESPTEWETLARLPGPLEAFRFAGVSTEECARIRGCYQDEAASEALACTVPCRLEPLASPTLPTAPAPPMVLPCPAGWTPAHADTATICDVPERLACPGSTFQPSTASDCRAVIPDCDGQYAAGLPQDAIYVSSSDSASQAVAAAPEGATIALSTGLHLGPIDVPRAMTLIGCAGTVVQGTVFADFGVQMEAMTVEGNVFGDGIVLDAIHLTGLLGATSATVTDSRLDDEAMIDRAADISASVTASVTATDARLVVTDSFTIGRLLSMGGTLSVRQSVISSFVGGTAIRGNNGAVVSAEEVLFAGPGNAGAFVGAEATLHRAWLRTEGRGFDVISSTVSASDVVVRDSVFFALVLDGSVLRTTRMHAHRMGTTVTAEGSEIIIEDFTSTDGRGPFAAQAFESRSTISRAHVSGLAGTAFRFWSPDAVLDDIQITDGVDPGGRIEGESMCAISALRLGEVRINRLRQSELYRQGLCAREGVTMVVADYSATNIGDRVALATALEPTRIELTRTDVDGAGDGLVAFLRGEIVAEDVRLTNLDRIFDYAPFITFGTPLGRGVFMNPDATMDLERFEISHCGGLGVSLPTGTDQVSPPDALRMRDGKITNNPIGAFIGFQPRHLLIQTAIYDNVQDFDAPME